MPTPRQKTALESYENLEKDSIPGHKKAMGEHPDEWEKLRSKLDESDDTINPIILGKGKNPGKFICREKIEDYLRFLTHAGETRFSIFAWESLRKLCHFVIFMGLMLTLTI